MALNSVNLETARLTLRELAFEDVGAMQLWASDPEVVQFMPWGPNSEEHTKAFLLFAGTMRRQNPRRSFELGLVRKDSGDLVGSCGIRIRSNENRAGDIGCVLRRDAWGLGFATETAEALLGFGFHVLGLHRIWATCHVDNVASARVLEKLGMQREGRLRHDVLQRGTWRDSYLFAMLDQDFAVRAGNSHDTSAIA